MKIAVVGSGISGMAAAYYLAEQQHEVHLYEAAARLGGHTATMDLEYAGETRSIDTGFIVFNDRTYPHFNALLAKLGVESKPTGMSFSVSDAASGVEYAGTSLNTLFAQRKNLIAPRFLRMVRDILRFNREVENDLARHPALADLPLGAYLRQFNYGNEFATHYLLPMGAAIWSSSLRNTADMPLQFFVKFFRNHGLLDIRKRPQWYVIAGGSRNYIGPLTARYRRNIFLSTPVMGIKREPHSANALQVSVTSSRGRELYDHVVMACHSDQALRLLADASAAERRVLGALQWTRNEVVVHTDTSLLPRNRRCWSSWNVSLGRQQGDLPALTYNMNILQGLQSRHTWCATLNQTALIDPAKIVGTYHYDHPQFTLAAIEAQREWATINGTNGLWFCGAWWRNGFHEDGVWSALRVAERINALPDLQPALAG